MALLTAIAPRLSINTVARNRPNRRYSVTARAVQKQDNVSLDRRDAIRQLLGAAFIVQGASLITAHEAGAAGISITTVPASVAQKMKERDEAMDFKCKGGMFDCDGDRREFAKNQYKTFVEKNKQK